MHKWIIRAGLPVLLLALASPLLAQEATEVPAPVATPVVAASAAEAGITLELLFDTLPQGGFGVARLAGPGIREAQASLVGQPVPFAPAADAPDTWYAIVPVPMDLGQRQHTLAALVLLADGTVLELGAPFTVASGGFIQQNFSIPADRAYLIEPDVEALEFARLDAYLKTYQAVPLYGDDGWGAPLAGDLTSPFGAVRTMNERVQTRHTGWDIRSIIGMPVETMASGVVAFAGRMDIRGNYVLVDHGYGIFSGYAHLSQIHVVQGQPVVRGQIIGLTGDTGRSSGPHFHWETAILGQWVDSTDFLTTWLP
jgi:hypothetical protein